MERDATGWGHRRHPLRLYIYIISFISFKYNGTLIRGCSMRQKRFGEKKSVCSAIRVIVTFAVLGVICQEAKEKEQI